MVLNAELSEIEDDWLRPVKRPILNLITTDSCYEEHTNTLWIGIYLWWMMVYDALFVSSGC